MSLQRALFVMLSLRVGGAERVTTTLLTHLANRGGIELHLALVDNDGELRSELPSAVAVHSIGTRNPVLCLMRMHRLIRELRPDVVYSTMFPVNVSVSLLRPAFPPHTRLVLREVNVLEALTGGSLRGRLLRRIAARTFSGADAVICQSDYMRNDLCEGLNLSRGRTHSILNPVEFRRVQQHGRASNPFQTAGPGPHVLAVGRLMPKKGFDRLIAAAPSLVARHPDAHIWILGHGPDRTALLRQAADLGVADRVRLPGQTSNPYCWMRHADLFVLSSRHEGTPNALLEAIASECPVVVLDHPGGTREVMERTGQPHRIVDDLTAWHPDWFHRPPQAVLETAHRILNAERIADQYLSVLKAAGRAA